jgi:hypothetical protein
VRNPESLDQTDQDSDPPSALPETLATLKVQRQKLRRGMERLIDSLAEGVIDQDLFTSRMNRTKSRITDIETKLATHSVDQERRTHIRSVMIRLAELSTHLQGTGVGFSCSGNAFTWP